MEKKRISQIVFFKVASFIEQHKSDFEGKSTDWAAKKIAKETGIDVSPHSVAKAFDAVGISSRKRQKNDRPSKGLRALAGVVRRMASHIGYTDVGDYDILYRIRGGLPLVDENGQETLFQDTDDAESDG